MIRSLSRRSGLLGVGALFLALAYAGEAASQTQVKPGFNVFSVEQDIEIGRQSAAEAERQLRLVRDRSVDGYLNRIVGMLAAGGSGARFPYHAQAVNASEINAFALPGGPLYVNRGLIQSAHTEGQLAGVIAHEMAHIALRHATHNVSKAYMAQAGVGILGGVLGGRNGAGTAQIINAVGGFGLNTLFLKYSRDAETQADLLGAQMLARAGYDPMDMAGFFELLREQQRRDPGRLEQFFSSHPAPADRAARIRSESQSLGVSGGRTAAIGGFEDIQARLRGRGAAPSMGRLDQRRARNEPGRNREEGYGRNDEYGREDGYGEEDYGREGRYGRDDRYGRNDDYGRDEGYDSEDDYGHDEDYDRGEGYSRERADEKSGTGARRRADVRIDPPSSRFRKFQPRGGSFEIEYPENWRAHESQNGVTLAPEGGIVDDGGGQQGIVYGMVVSRFEPSRSGTGYAERRGGDGNAAFEQAMDDLVEQLTSTNAYLRRSGAARREVHDGARALSLVLTGRSPLTGREEKVTVVARELRGGDMIYSLLIAPGDEYAGLDRTFQRMVGSLRLVDDDLARR